MNPSSRISGEEGAVIVTFAISLVLIMLVTSFAVDVTNFFRHKRQLQTQADAAVLAGGSALYAGCSSNTEIFNQAEKYSGTALASYNKPKAAGDSGVVSRQWVTGNPCADGALEVQVTETDVKWFFPITAIAGSLRDDLDISASARVELKQIQGQGGTLPIALEEEESITNAWTWLVNEDLANTPILGTVRKLVKGTDGTTATPWTSETPIAHDVKQSNLGVRVAVDYAQNSACATATNACALLCGVGKVKCYDATGTAGLMHIHGYDPAPTAGARTPPVLQDISFVAAGCVGTSVFNSGGCAYTVTAKIDWVPEIDGGTVTQADARATVTGTIGGTAITLTPSGDTHTWTGTSGAISATGPSTLKLGWSMKDGWASQTKACGKKSGTNGQTTNTPGGNNTPICSGAWNGNAAPGVLDLTLGAATALHRTFVADSTRSGPITAASVTEGGTVMNSVVKCGLAASCPHNFTVSVDLPSELKLGSHRNLSVKVPGSNDGFLDCDPLHQDLASPTSNGKPRFVYQIANGCKGPRFATNPGDTCPDIASYGIDDPWICVASATGTKTGALQEGFNTRFFGTTNPNNNSACNKAPNNMSGGYGTVPENDPRIVSVMIVPRGALLLSGGTLFPVRIFAYFYVTGYDGENRCGNETSQTGDILGYFLKHTHPSDGGVFGTQPCKSGDLGGCVPVMTK
jgi:hypothetical protein